MRPCQARRSTSSVASIPDSRQLFNAFNDDWLYPGLRVGRRAFPQYNSPGLTDQVGNRPPQ